MITWLIEYASTQFNPKEGTETKKYMKYMSEKKQKKSAMDSAGRNNVGMDTKKQKALEATVRHALSTTPTKVRRARLGVARKNTAAQSKGTRQRHARTPVAALLPAQD